MSKQASSGAELRHLLPWACCDPCAATGRESRDFHYTLFTSHTISSPREEPQLCRVIISSSETTDTDRKCQDRSGGHTEQDSVPLGMFPRQLGFQHGKAASVWQKQKCGDTDSMENSGCAVGAYGTQPHARRACPWALRRPRPGAP